MTDKIPCGFESGERCKSLAIGVAKFKCRAHNFNFLITLPVCETHLEQFSSIPNPVDLQAIRFPIGDITCAQVYYSENSAGNPKVKNG